MSKHTLTDASSAEQSLKLIGIVDLLLTGLRVIGWNLATDWGRGDANEQETLLNDGYLVADSGIGVLSLILGAVAVSQAPVSTVHEETMSHD